MKTEELEKYLHKNIRLKLELNLLKDHELQDLLGTDFAKQYQQTITERLLGNANNHWNGLVKQICMKFIDQPELLEKYSNDYRYSYYIAANQNLTNKQLEKLTESEDPNTSRRAKYYLKKRLEENPNPQKPENLKEQLQTYTKLNHLRNSLPCEVTPETQKLITDFVGKHATSTKSMCRLDHLAPHLLLKELRKKVRPTLWRYRGLLPHGAHWVKLLNNSNRKLTTLQDLLDYGYDLLHNPDKIQTMEEYNIYVDMRNNEYQKSRESDIVKIIYSPNPEVRKQGIKQYERQLFYNKRTTKELQTIWTECPELFLQKAINYYYGIPEKNKLTISKILNQNDIPEPLLEKLTLNKLVELREILQAGAEE